MYSVEKSTVRKMSVVSLFALVLLMIAVMSINVQAQERTTSQSD